MNQMNKYAIIQETQERGEVKQASTEDQKMTICNSNYNFAIHYFIKNLSLLMTESEVCH